MTTTPARSAGIAGLLSFAAMAAAFATLPADPGGTAPADIARRYASGSDGYLRATVLESLSVALLVVLVAGICLRLRDRGGDLAALAAGFGGAMVAVCQLVGYGLIATLALGTAAAGDEDTVMAVYDASAVAFNLSYVGLALLCLATAVELLRGSDRRAVVGGVSALVGLTAVVGASAYASDGALSPHGDLGFVVVLLQLVWTVTASVSLLRREPHPQPGARRVAAAAR